MAIRRRAPAVRSPAPASKSKPAVMSRVLIELPVLGNSPPGDADALADGLGVAVPDALGLADGFLEADRLGDGLGLADGLGESLGLGETLGLGDIEGLGCAEGLAETDGLGETEGLCDGLSLLLGDGVRLADGLFDGDGVEGGVPGQVWLRLNSAPSCSLISTALAAVSSQPAVVIT